MGVLYRYVPGLTKQPLPYPRLAIAQWVAFAGGTAGLVVHFWLGSWSGRRLVGRGAGRRQRASVRERVAAGGLAYVALAARTLVFTLVDPAPSRTTLPILY